MQEPCLRAIFRKPRGSSPAGRLLRGEQRAQTGRSAAGGDQRRQRMFEFLRLLALWPVGWHMALRDLNVIQRSGEISALLTEFRALHSGLVKPGRLGEGRIELRHALVAPTLEVG